MRKMYIINDIIILLATIYIIYSLGKKDYERVIIAVIISYISMPVVKIGEKGINSAYIISGILAIWIVIAFLKKQLDINRQIIVYVVLSGMSIGVIGVAWILQGNFVLSHILHFAGALQYIVGVVGVALLYAKLEGKSNSCFLKAIEYSLLWNFMVVIAQMFTNKFGLELTKMFYTYPGRTAPIETMEEMGRFVRAFGAFYSPTITGAFCLLLCAYFIAQVLKKPKYKEELAFLLITLLIGIFAFSKTVIIGIFIVLLLAIIFNAIIERKIHIKKCMTLCICVVCAFIIIGCVGSLIGLKGQVEYYFGKIIAPVTAFETRYNIKDTEEIIEEIISTENTEEVEETTKEEALQEDGNQKEAIKVFLKNPIIGVGPAPVNGEFVGDSQYMTTLHDGGITNALIYLGLYGYLFICACKKKNSTKMLIIISIAFDCLSMSAFTTAVCIPFVAYLLCDSEEV